MELIRSEAISRRLIDAASSGQPEQITAIFTANAWIWHAMTGQGHDVTTAAMMFAAMVELVQELRYTDVRITPLRRGFVQQHRLRGRTHSGELDVEACIVCDVDGELIARIDEYLDSAALSRAGLTFDTTSIDRC